MNGATGGFAAEALQEELRQEIHEDGDQEEDEADLEEGLEVQVGGGLREFVGDDAGKRVAGAKSEAEISGGLPMTIVTAIVSPRARPRPRMMAPKMPRFGVAEHGDAGHLPAGGPEGVGRLALEIRARKGESPARRR